MKRWVCSSGSGVNANIGRKKSSKVRSREKESLLEGQKSEDKERLYKCGRQQSKG